MLSFYFKLTSFELYGYQVRMQHLAVSQNNYQVKFISLHMNRLINLVHYFNNPVIGSLTPIIFTSLAAVFKLISLYFIYELDPFFKTRNNLISSNCFIIEAILLFEILVF